MNDSRKEDLLKEYGENRVKLHGMLSDLIDFRSKMDILLPKSVDYRNKFVLEERMKTITSLINTELAIRRQIDDNIKNEISILDKIKESEDGMSIDDIERVAAEIIKQKETQE